MLTSSLFASVSGYSQRRRQRFGHARPSQRLPPDARRIVVNRHPISICSRAPDDGVEIPADNVARWY
jgi:hypothetical protein